MVRKTRRSGCKLEAERTERKAALGKDLTGQRFGKLTVLSPY